MQKQIQFKLFKKVQYNEKLVFGITMFAIALGMSPIEKITVVISASIFIIAFTLVSIKGDLRKLANELIEDNESNQDN